MARNEEVNFSSKRSKKSVIPHFIIELKEEIPVVRNDDPVLAGSPPFLNMTVTRTWKKNSIKLDLWLIPISIIFYDLISGPTHYAQATQPGRFRVAQVFSLLASICHTSNVYLGRPIPKNFNLLISIIQMPSHQWHCTDKYGMLPELM